MVLSEVVLVAFVSLTAFVSTSVDSLLVLVPRFASEWAMRDAAPSSSATWPVWRRWSS